MGALRAFLGHPATTAGFGTLIGYGIILVLLTVVLFAIPYLLFLLL